MAEPARLSRRPSQHPSSGAHAMITAFYHPAFAAPIGDHIMPMRKFALVAEGLKARADVLLAGPEQNIGARFKPFRHERELAHRHDVIADRRGECGMVKRRDHRVGATRRMLARSSG